MEKCYYNEEVKNNESLSLSMVASKRSLLIEYLIGVLHHRGIFTVSPLFH